jgi:hypothetical protein
MRLERESFGPVLRAARERCGVSRAQLAAETKIAAELWADLEDNDLSRWPRQIYARSYIRDYAIRVGMDPEETVNEFCRLFPEWGDRRAEKLIRDQAAIINHDFTWQDLPHKVERRANRRVAGPTPTLFVRHRVRIIGAALDSAAILALGWIAVLCTAPFWPSLAVVAMVYTAGATLFSQKGFGVVGADLLIRLINAMPAAKRRLVSSRAS